MSSPTDTAEFDKAKALADRFRAMATAIELNGVVNFGGAFVVIPPEGGGEALETLILDNRQDVAQFWIFLKTKSENEIAAVDQKQRAGAAFGRGR